MPLEAFLKDNFRLGDITDGAYSQLLRGSITTGCSSMALEMDMGSSKPRMAKNMLVTSKQILNMEKDNFT